MTLRRTDGVAGEPRSFQWGIVFLVAFLLILSAPLANQQLTTAWGQDDQVSAEQANPNGAQQETGAAAEEQAEPTAQEPAGDGEAEAPPESEPSPLEEGDVQQVSAEPLLVWVYNAAGVFFWPQLLLSFLVVGMIVLYSMQVRRENFIPDQFVREFETRLKEKKYQEAFELARVGASYLERVVAAGLSRLSAGYRAAKEAMESVAEEEDIAYEHRLSYLAMLANVATMVGLLGTVWGMVAAFREIAAADVQPKPRDLANDVSMALITTVWGLMQAIPAVVAYTILRNRVTRLALEVENERDRLMARFANVGARSREGDSTIAQE